MGNVFGGVDSIVTDLNPGFSVDVARLVGEATNGAELVLGDLTTF